MFVNLKSYIQWFKSTALPLSVSSHFYLHKIFHFSVFFHFPKSCQKLIGLTLSSIRSTYSCFLLQPILAIIHFTKTSLSYCLLFFVLFLRYIDTFSVLHIDKCILIFLSSLFSLADQHLCVFLSSLCRYFLHFISSISSSHFFFIFSVSSNLHALFFIPPSFFVF